MNSEPKSPDRFEDRLLLELKQFVAMQPAPQSDQSSNRTKPFHRPRYRVAMAGATLVAAAGVAVAVGHDPAAPAYAIESQPNGSVTVKISSLEDAAGLQNKLRAQGIPAHVRYVPQGKVCKAPQLKTGSGHGVIQGGQSFSTREGRVDSGEPSLSVEHEAGDKKLGPPSGGPPMGPINVKHSADGATEFTIPVDAVPKGQSLWIDGNSGSGANFISVAVLTGEPKPCELVDAPAAPAGAPSPVPAPAK